MLACTLSDKGGKVLACMDMSDAAIGTIKKARKGFPHCFKLTLAQPPAKGWSEVKSSDVIGSNNAALQTTHLVK